MTKPELVSSTGNTTDTGTSATAGDGNAHIVGVMLAAGRSDRFGPANKLTAEVDGTPVVRLATAALLESDLESVMVVVGHESAAVREALSGLSFEFVESPTYQEGQSTSVRAAIKALSERQVASAVFALGDIPFVDPTSIGRLIGGYREGAGLAFAAAYEGAPGNPALFDVQFFGALVDMDGARGGRRLFVEAGSSVLVGTDDPGVCRDIDVPTDLPDE